MKNFDKIFTAFFVFCFSFLIIFNLFLSDDSSESVGTFKVEANRAAQKISNGEQINLKEFSTISKIFERDDKNFYDNDTPFVIKNIDSKQYCIVYKEQDQNKNFLNIFNKVFKVVMGFNICNFATVIKF